MVVLTDLSEQSSSIQVYDVFLSFRGTDTRYNFTDHLLKALREATIDTFFDDSEIQIGDELKPELESAIKTSRASVIVLSKNYASSTWCLDELALIMEQRRTSNHIIFPIFYHVNPSDVRKQRGSFGDAMVEHKNRLKNETNEEKRSQLAQKIKKWENALTQVADMKGEEANDRRRETILIEEMIKKVSSRLDIHKRNQIPRITGMKSSIRIITSFLKDGDGQSSQILTIWGMAGIGKTYLANYAFQLHYLDFDRSCFLEDIERKCEAPDGLLNLQKQLLKDVRARNWTDINNINAGTLKIENFLFQNRTLLVLDGINQLEQLDVLMGTKGLHPESKIIITSNNRALTEKCRLFETQVPPNHTKHLLQGLDDKESLELLSWHAFGCKKPTEGHTKESMKVVEYCNGHPLALKVLGSSLRSEDATWEDILESLGKEISRDIKKVLKVSFEALPSEKDKELFKYISCLFVGEDRKFTEDILKACGICKSSGIKILINRCLLTVGLSNKLGMHQLLQDMGRDIVRQESQMEPWKRSIIWHHEECLDVLRNRRGTPIIQGISLDMRTLEKETMKEPSSGNMQKFGFRSISSFSWVHVLLSIIWWLFEWASRMRSSSRKIKGDFETLALNEMCNLRLLQLNYVQCSGSYKNFPQGLRWLCMHGFHLTYIPSDLQMENIVALDMSNSKLQQLWKKPKLLRSLKFLNLSNCHELVSVDHFSTFPLLERLTLSRCTSLVKVCESIGTSCQKLEVLDLSNCNKLKKLPRSIGKLKNLTELLIDGCSNLDEFPAEMKDLESLKVIKADNINMKSHGSSSPSKMVPRISKFFVSALPGSLVRLSLTYCNLYNEDFPMDFSSLSMLKKLYLDGNPIDSMPDCVRSQSTLETLTFVQCVNLKTVLFATILLNFLDIHDCYSLEKVTFHQEKLALPVIAFSVTSTMTEIQNMFKIQALEDINEEILHSLGWINIKYLNNLRFWNPDFRGAYHFRGSILPAQMLYEHGIFSTYLQGREIPKMFTHRINGSSFTLQSFPKNGKIQGINVCVVYRIPRLRDVGTPVIKIGNLTKNSSWTYHPKIFAETQDYNFETGDEAVVWLSHWMFEKNEFEDGDVVNVHFSVKPYIHNDNEEAHCANIREYGISLVYDDNDGGNQKENYLSYYKSWKHIIGKDLSIFKVSSGHYLLRPWLTPIDLSVPSKSIPIKWT